MNLSQDIEQIAQNTGCEHEITVIDGIIDALKNSKTLNAAVLGETNCGKTSLINQLVGREVRKPSMLPLDEAPLMVTFHEEEKKPSYEVVLLDGPEQEASKISFFEIPINLAIDYDTRQLSPMLEEMDVVIYLISAVTPAAALDIANIAAIEDKLPVLYYVSKADLVEDRDERKTCLEYIKQQLPERAEIVDGSQAGAAGEILEKITGLSASDLRLFHIARLKRRAADVVAAQLNKQVERLDEEQKCCEEVQAAAGHAFREQALVWNGLRVQLLERQAEAAKFVDTRVDEYTRAAKKKLLQELREEGYRKEWASHEMESSLRAELECAMEEILPRVEDRAGADAAWLISEVNRKFDTRITVEAMSGRLISEPTPEGIRDDMREPGYSELAAAAGSGLLAGGAVLSNMTLLPTCIIAIPASLAALHFLQKRADGQKEYRQEMERLVGKSCEQSFEELSKKLCCAVECQYGQMLNAIRQEVGAQEANPRLAEISRQREDLLHIIAKLRS